MARGTPNRGRGGRGGAFDSPGTPRGGRGGGRGRGGRGRGGGVASQDFSGVSLDYNALSEAALGFHPSPAPSTPHPKPRQQQQGQSTPNLYSAFPPTPPNERSNQSSGYTTPKQGLGARGGRGGPAVARGGGRGAFLGAAGRGGMVGGLGFSAGSPAGRGRGRGGPVVGMGQGFFRPLLVPVSFVKASGLTPAMGGDKEDDAEPSAKVEPGDLEDQVMEGKLVEVVRDLELEDIDAKNDYHQSEDSTMDVAESTPEDEEAAEVQRALVPLPKPIVQEDDESSSSDDEEQIVFHPTPSAATAIAEPQSTEEEALLFIVDTEPSPVTLASSNTNSTPLGAPSPAPKSVSFAAPPPSSTAEVNPPSAPSPPQPQSTTSKPFKPVSVPAPTLTKAQKLAMKKVGKKARKAGKSHARSGNQHLFVNAPPGYSDEEMEEEDDRAGREMFEKMGAVDLSDEEPAQAGEEPGEARVGDSDLEWGSNGPRSEGEMDVDDGSPRLSGKERKALRRQQRDEQKQAEKLARLSMATRAKVEKTLVRDGVAFKEVEAQELLVQGGLKVKGRKGGKKGRKQIEMLSAEDYERNVLGLDSTTFPDAESVDPTADFLISPPSSDDEDDDDGPVDMAAAESFARGLIGSKSGRQQTLDDMEDRARDDSDVWRTSSGSESEGSDDSVDTGDEEEMLHALAEADAEVEAALAAAEDSLFDPDLSHTTSFDSSAPSSDEDAAIEAALLAGGTIRLSSMGVSGSGGRRDQRERKRAAKGKGKRVEYDSFSDDSSEEEVGIGEGGNTWADDDEDYIRGVQDIIAANSHLLEGGRGADRKNRKKLFKAVSEGNFEDFDFEYEEEMMMEAGPSKKKNKHEKPGFSGAFSADLEDQWSKDRSKKSEYKRQRALARAEAVEKTSMSKKGPRAPPQFEGSSDAAFLNSKIRDFLLYDMSSASIALPPMSKKSRVAVHLLAEVYGLKSKSLGKGKSRFPVLERTSRSTTYGVDERKIRAILGTASGEREGRWQGGKAAGKMGGLWAALSGDGKKSGGGGGGGGGGKKNSEGAVVGQGADALGEGNIGFALLKKMGWTEGGQIGMSGGISEPISARIKTSKSGLGSGYSVTRAEAQIMGRSNDQW